MAGNLKNETKLVSCITCIMSETVSNPEADFEIVCWDNSYNLHVLSDEEEAYTHSKSNPFHIMVEGFDFGYKVNGF